MKLEYILVYENSLDKFDIEHCQIKVKVTVGLQSFFHLPQYKYNTTLAQAKILLSMYVHLILIYKIYEYRHA